MTSRRKRTLWAAVLVAVLPPVLAGLSRITTEEEWYGFFHSGSWSVIVVAEQTGSPIPGATVEVAERSWVPFAPPPGETKWLRDRTDETGRIELAISHEESPGYGGTAYRLFWIWRIGPPRRKPVGLLRITAEGFRPATIDTETILASKGDVVVDLRKAGD